MDPGRESDPDRLDAILLAHGAGNDMKHPFIRPFHHACAAAGLLGVRFNFPHTERGRQAPDRPAMLAAAWAAVIRAVRENPCPRPRRLVLAGKSPGGRIASLVVAEGEPCAGLVFRGYPPRPAGPPATPRNAHRPDIRCPSLFPRGDSDPLCELSRPYDQLARLGGPGTLEVIAGGDHSFNVPRSAGRSRAVVRQGMAETIARWIEGLEASTPAWPDGAARVHGEAGGGR